MPHGKTTTPPPPSGERRRSPGLAHWPRCTSGYRPGTLPRSKAPQTTFLSLFEPSLFVRLTSGHYFARPAAVMISRVSSCSATNFANLLRSRYRGAVPRKRQNLPIPCFHRFLTWGSSVVIVWAFPWGGNPLHWSKTRSTPDSFIVGTFGQRLIRFSTADRQDANLPGLHLAQDLEGCWLEASILPPMRGPRPSRPKGT